MCHAIIIAVAENSLSLCPSLTSSILGVSRDYLTSNKKSNRQLKEEKKRAEQNRMNTSLDILYSYHKLSQVCDVKAARQLASDITLSGAKVFDLLENENTERCSNWWN